MWRRPPCEPGATAPNQRHRTYAWANIVRSAPNGATSKKVCARHEYMSMKRQLLARQGRKPSAGAFVLAFYRFYLLVGGTGIEPVTPRV